MEGISTDSERKTVLLYAPLALWRFHIATDAEIAQRFLDEGHSVYWVACRTELPICQANPGNLKSICMACEHRSKEGLDWLSGEGLHVLTLENLTDHQQAHIESLDATLCSDKETLSGFEVDGSDIGLAALSSLISQLGEPDPDLENVSDITLMHLRAAMKVHYSISNYISEIRPDEIVLFNGRFSVNRPALRVAQQSSARVVTHERSYTQGRYLLFENDYPHALELGKQSIASHWLNSSHDLDQRKELGGSWFRNQREGRDQGWFSFVAKQKRGSAPDDFDERKNNIAIFVSSEDEYCAFIDWKNLIYSSENDGISQLIESFSGDEQFHIYIRIHPNLAGIDNSQTRGLARFKSFSDSVTVIDAGSTVDTYVLIEKSDVVVTFGATVGIEAAYMRKPSVLLGRSYYEDLGCVARPGDHDEAVETIRSFVGQNERVSTEAPVGAYKYGYYLVTVGEPFQYVMQDAVGITGIKRDNKVAYFKVSWPARIVWVLEKGLRSIGLGNLIKK